jgi:hypothetical protein
MNRAQKLNGYKRLVLIGCCSISFIACAGNTYQLPLPQYDTAQYEEVGRASETAMGAHIFGLFPAGLNNKTERAIQSVIAQRGGDAITDVTVKERWWWAYVLNLYQVDVEGTVLRKK